MVQKSRLNGVLDKLLERTMLLLATARHCDLLLPATAASHCCELLLRSAAASYCCELLPADIASTPARVRAAASGLVDEVVDHVFEVVVVLLERQQRCEQREVHGDEARQLRVVGNGQRGGRRGGEKRGKACAPSSFFRPPPLLLLLRLGAGTGA